MRLGFAIVAGLALGAGLAWWSTHRDSLPDDAIPPPPFPVRADLPGGAAPPADKSQPRPLYRWRDAQGVLQVTDVPPTDRPYEQVRIRDDRNVVPMSGPAPEPDSAD